MTDWIRETVAARAVERGMMAEISARITRS